MQGYAGSTGVYRAWRAHKVLHTEHMGTVLCVEGLWHGVFGFPIALGGVAVV